MIELDSFKKYLIKYQNLFMISDDMSKMSKKMENDLKQLNSQRRKFERFKKRYNRKLEQLDNIINISERKEKKQTIDEKFKQEANKKFGIKFKEGEGFDISVIDNSISILKKSIDSLRYHQKTYILSLENHGNNLKKSISTELANHVNHLILSIKNEIAQLETQYSQSPNTFDRNQFISKLEQLKALKTALSVLDSQSVYSKKGHSQKKLSQTTFEEILTAIDTFSNKFPTVDNSAQLNSTRITDSAVTKNVNPQNQTFNNTIKSQPTTTVSKPPKESSSPSINDSSNHTSTTSLIKMKKSHINKFVFFKKRLSIFLLSIFLGIGALFGIVKNKSLNFSCFQNALERDSTDMDMTEKPDIEQIINQSRELDAISIPTFEDLANSSEYNHRSPLTNYEYFSNIANQYYEISNYYSSLASDNNCDNSIRPNLIKKAEEYRQQGNAFDNCADYFNNEIEHILNRFRIDRIDRASNVAQKEYSVPQVKEPTLSKTHQLETRERFAKTLKKTSVETFTKGENPKIEIGIPIIVPAGTKCYADSSKSQCFSDQKSEETLEIFKFAAVDPNTNKFIPNSTSMSYNDIKSIYPDARIMAALINEGVKNPTSSSVIYWIDTDSILQHHQPENQQEI